MHFFIVGTGRCGTRLLRRIFNRHPLVFVPHETHWIPMMHAFFGMTRQPLAAYTDIIDRTEHVTGVPTIDLILREVSTTRQPFYRELERELDRRDAIDVVSVNDALYRLVAARQSKRLVGDKTPDYGFYMALLQQLWPRARFVHLVRDGRDVALSMSKHAGFQRMVQLRVNNWCPISFNRYYRIGHVRRRFRAATMRVMRPLERRRRPRGSLRDYLWLWESRITRIADEASRLKPGSLLEIKYEDLLAEPDDGVRRLAEFLELPASPEWQSAAREAIVPGNVGKISDRQLHDELTSLGQATLSRYGYT